MVIPWLPKPRLCTGTIVKLTFLEESFGYFALSLSELVTDGHADGWVLETKVH
jgi:hypothetical protein